MSVGIRGASQLRKSLREFEPDLAKSMQKELVGILGPMVKKSRNLIPEQSPLSNWAPRSFNEGRFPTFNVTLARKGLTYQTTPSKPNRQGFSFAASLHNKTAAGAIYETAGRRAAGTSKRSRPNFASSFPEMRGADKKRGRVMFAIWDQDHGKANQAALKSILNAARQFRTKVGTNGN